MTSTRKHVVYVSATCIPACSILISSLSPSTSYSHSLYLFPYRHMDCPGHHWSKTTCCVWPHPHPDWPAQSWAIWRIGWWWTAQWHLYTGHGDMGMSLIVHTPLCTVSLSWAWDEGKWMSTLETLLLLILRVALVVRDCGGYLLWDFPHTSCIGPIS